MKDGLTVVEMLTLLHLFCKHYYGRGSLLDTRGLKMTRTCPCSEGVHNLARRKVVLGNSSN